jgi:hypothetical protein
MLSSDDLCVVPVTKQTGIGHWNGYKKRLVRLLLHSGQTITSERFAKVTGPDARHHASAG